MLTKLLLSVFWCVSICPMAHDSFVFRVALLCNINIPILVPCFNKKDVKRKATRFKFPKFKFFLMIQISFTKKIDAGEEEFWHGNHMDNMWKAKKRLISFRVLWAVFGSTFFSQCSFSLLCDSAFYFSPWAPVPRTP